MVNECLVCGFIGEPTDWYEGSDYMYKENKEIHLYGCCSKCGSWSISKIPDMTPYYPRDYYSYKFVEGDTSSQSKIDQAKYIIKKAELIETSSVLDWGAGSVALLRALWNEGVGEEGNENRLRAYDPYAENSTEYNLKIQNTTPTDMMFDCIISSHSMEHQVKPSVMVLMDMLKILKPKGCIVIELPIADSITHMMFRESSVCADIPRHTTVASRMGLVSMAEQAGLTISAIDSVQFLGHLLVSELIQGGNDYSTANDMAIKAKPSIQVMHTHVSKWIEQQNMGDVARFILRRK